MKQALINSVFVTLLGLLSALALAQVSDTAKETAAYAVETYAQAMTDTLAELVEYQTVASAKLSLDQNPEFVGFKSSLAQHAEALGLEYEDHGHVVIVAIGSGKEKVGILTHGDVMPADPAKWEASPFSLDTQSEPGKLIARGAEDNKGPIATALYAMKAIQDRELALKRRVELLIYLAEESDWEPLRAFLENYPVPQYSITIDAVYPVVTAEKGWGEVQVTAIDTESIPEDGPYLAEFYGGYFRGQVPDEAHATVINADPQLKAAIRSRAAAQSNIKYEFRQDGDRWLITTRGKSAHSAQPQHGINAITFLAAALGARRWPNNAAGATVDYLNQLVGTGVEGAKFGDIAYTHDFMGPLTATVTMVKPGLNGLTTYLNLRRPAGKATKQLESEIRTALSNWQQHSGARLAGIQIDLDEEPLIVKDAGHIQPLLAVFRHFSGMEDAKPIAIGGSSNAKLLPDAISFGPSMPGQIYTGHTEHEFITEEQFRLNLKMYTAMMIEIANL
ncbi:dipeptidase [Biformimicrobium ophioploci]|uniref:Dipeptidase n=1 Tax=Biformimicrobium ophioploci TaxID=3036711 RepID=A0ABQ6LY34_9GAMM|nr:dipeptidase [Microbulbifer sp. NKW57]GMG86960.1 dipeptidase [Microbulbifer sp. NKW57]